MKSVELFVGAGGLGMGVSRAGFVPQAVIEWDHDACEAIRENQRRGVEPVSHWPLHETDVRDFDFGQISGGIHLLAGGPPCQPFSLGGKHRGHRDERDMFSQAVRAVRELKPRAVLLENVKGLTRQSFARYFEFIRLQLGFPEITRRKDESWVSHLDRIEKVVARARVNGLRYEVRHKLLNAADYGVPQRRERVFIVGFRADLAADWDFPEATHSQDALLWEQWVTGEYWERHEVSKKQRPSKPTRFTTRIDCMRSENVKPKELPWLTVRDAIFDLSDSRKTAGSAKVLNHSFVTGARAYVGHTGSPLDEPAKTLKAGDHGVPGGENMLALPDGTVRYFTVRESARLQTFPDDYVFCRSWTESMRQLGNAVPVRLGQAVAAKVRTTLIKHASKGVKA